MTRYWVVGGEYTDTHFAKVAAGASEEWIGPFVDYQAAKKEWARRAWGTVDSATCAIASRRATKSIRPALTDH